MDDREQQEPGVHRLPVVRIGRTDYFVDERLRQLRNVENPHDFIGFDDDFPLEP